MAARRKTPYRILLPLANPRTARDLVRIGAGVANGRPTEITALGIVEVPEGVSLSEGATQARVARRLLQRVLDFGEMAFLLHFKNPAAPSISNDDPC